MAIGRRGLLLQSVLGSMLGIPWFRYWWGGGDGEGTIEYPGASPTPTPPTLPEGTLRFTSEPPELTQNLFYVYEPTIAGGTPPYRFSFAPGGDTDNLVLDADTGRVSGKTIYHRGFVLAVTDAAGKKVTQVQIPRAALPPLPLPTGAKLMGLGHSFIQRTNSSRYNANQTVTNGLQGHSRRGAGVLTYVDALDERFNSDIFVDAENYWQAPSTGNALTGAHQGIGGDHLYAIYASPGMINRIPYAAARRPQIVYLDIGTNDISSGVGGVYGSDRSAAAVIAGIDHALRLLRQAGIWAVLQTIAWRFDTSFSDAQRQTIREVNEWIKGQARREGVRLCDTTALDGTAETPWGTAEGALIGSDGIHLTDRGAVQRAKILLPILRTMVRAGNCRAQKARTTNLFPHAGTPGGTGRLGTGVTGAVADGMTAWVDSGTSTVIAAKQQQAGAGEYQALTITPVPDGKAEHAVAYGWASNIALEPLGIIDGDWIEIIVPIQWDDWAGWRAAAQYNEIYTGNAFTWQGNHSPAAMPGTTMYLRTQMPVTGYAGAKNLRAARPLRITFNPNAGGSGTVRIGSPVLRKIENPRLAWELPA